MPGSPGVGLIDEGMLAYTLLSQSEGQACSSRKLKKEHATSHEVSETFLDVPTTATHGNDRGDVLAQLHRHH